MNNLSNIRMAINDPDGVFYTDNHLLDRVNEAHLEQWASATPQLTTATWTATVSAEMMDLPSSIMIPKYVVYDNKQYWIATQADLEQYSSKWRTESVSQPKWFIRWSHNKIRVWPPPDDDYVMKVVGVPWPTEITSTNSHINIERSYDRAVEHKAAGSLLALSRPDLSEIHFAEAKALAYNYRVTLRNQQPHNIRRLHPANRINKAQSGNIAIGRMLK